MNNRFFCLAICMVISLSSLSTFGDTIPAKKPVDPYLLTVANYFEVKYDDVLSNTRGLSKEEIPVAYYLAQHAKTTTPASIIKMRNDNKSWSETASRLGLKTAVFYVVVSGTVISTTFTPIFDKFRAMPEQEWNKLQLTNDEIINLVNLRVISSHYDYSPYKVMSARDANQSWDTVNTLIAQAKRKYLESLKKKK